MSAVEGVPRPGGKPYRPRKAPQALVWSEDTAGGESRWGVVVQRTHDVERARRLAVELVKWQVGAEGVALMETTAPDVCWLRLVPWDDTSGADQSWQTVQPTDKGAVPCVTWEWES